MVSVRPRGQLGPRRDSLPLVIVERSPDICLGEGQVSSHCPHLHRKEIVDLHEKRVIGEAEGNSVEVGIHEAVATEALQVHRQSRRGERSR